MSRIEFLDFEYPDENGSDPARARERFSVAAHSIDSPDFEVSEGADEATSNGDAEPSGPPRSDRSGRSDRDADHPHAECYACPVGVAYGTMRGVRPDTTDRLANALADLVEAAAGALEMLAGENKRPRDRLRRVDIE